MPDHRDLRRVLILGPLARVYVTDSHWPIDLHNLCDKNEQVIVFYALDDGKDADLQFEFPVSALANESGLDSDNEMGRNFSYVDEKSGSENEVDGLNLDDPNTYWKLKSRYYKVGAFHGPPSGCLMFGLCHLLKKNTHEMMWLACVSPTDQFVHDERYQAGVMEL